MFEQIVKIRLLKSIERDDLSEFQYGFRRGMSTVHGMERVMTIWDKAIRERRHCLLILLYVKNAFNSLRWDNVLKEMQRREFPTKIVKLIKSYLSDRWLVINTSDGQHKVQVFGGVPQGSIIGPFMWNIVYDGVLKIKLRRGVFLVAFADDIGILLVDDDLSRMEVTVNRAISDMVEWYDSEVLQLAPHKSESILLTGRRYPGGIPINIGNDSIRVCRRVKYLGVVFDNNQAFKAHIADATDKARKYATHLNILMKNTKMEETKPENFITMW